MTLEKYLIEAKKLKVHFPVSSGSVKSLFENRKKSFVKAVDGVDFYIKNQETLALVGESGCGKTTTGRALIGLNKPTDGEIIFNGDKVDHISYKDAQKLRKQMQFIFQDPFSSLNPRMTVKTIIGRPMIANGICTHLETKERIEWLLKEVGLSVNQLDRFPHEFSGGQKQRISIARALAVEPKLIIADEPTAALDVSIQCQILNLLFKLKEELGLTMLFISHDLSVVNYISDRTAIMYLGKIVEIGSTKEIFKNPAHPYSKALVDALPRHGHKKVNNAVKLNEFISSAVNPPSGCNLHPRCPYALKRCKTDLPLLKNLDDGRQAACHLL